MSTEILQLARQKFKPFIKLVYPDYRFGAMHHLLAEALEKAMHREPGYTRLAISMPPRHGKSLTISQLFPQFAMGHAGANGRQEEVMSVSYAASLANDFGFEVRQGMKQPIYNAIFPETGLEGDRGNGGAIFRTPSKSIYRSFGVDGALTGKGATILIVDDPIKNRAQADSKTYIAKLHKSFSADAYSRLEPGAIVIIVHTRWHEQDLIGHVLDKYAMDNWRYIRLPALCDSEDDLLGRELGEALVPFRYSREKLLKMQSGTSVKDWAALYQNDPIAGSGSFWKPEFMRLITLPKLTEYEFTFCTWDCANELNADADYTAWIFWGIKDDKLYAINCGRTKVEFPDLVALLLEVDEEHTPAFHLIEKAVNGVALKQFLDANEPGLATEYCSAHRNKGIEFNIASSSFGQGAVLFDEDLIGDTHVLLEELTKWPSVANDDLAIACLHGVRWFQQNWSDNASKQAFSVRRLLKSYGPSSKIIYKQGRRRVSKFGTV